MLREDLIELSFNIFDEIFVKVMVVLMFVIVLVFINLFFGVVVVVGLLIVIFVFFVDVNFESWRRKIVDEIFQIVLKNKYDVLSKLLLMVEKMCRKIVVDLNSVFKKFEKWMQKIECMDIKESKYVCVYVFV